MSMFIHRMGPLLTTGSIHLVEDMRGRRSLGIRYAMLVGSGVNKEPMDVFLGAETDTGYVTIDADAEGEYALVHVDGAVFVTRHGRRCDFVTHRSVRTMGAVTGACFARVRGIRFPMSVCCAPIDHRPLQSPHKGRDVGELLNRMLLGD